MVKSAISLSSKVVVRRDWTKGSIIQNILLLSWPMIVLGVLYTLNLVLEMIWVGKLGAASIAGVGVSGYILSLVITVRGGLGAGERAMVARYVGGNDIAGANHIAGQSFVISAAYGALITVIGIIFTQPIFNLFGLEPDTLAEGVTYLRLLLAGWFMEAFWMSSFYTMQASGDSITPMKVAIFIRIVNAVICPFLVLGWWVFPRLGVSGAAITYLVATGLGMSIGLWVLFTGKTRLRLTLKDLYPDFKVIWRILRIGMPASFMGLGKTLGDLMFTWLMIPFGTLALASHNLITRIESFINSPSTSLGTGAGVLVGQNLGAGQPKQAARSGWLAMVLSASFMIVCSLVLLVWSENIISLFNVDPELAQVGTTFLRIAVAGYLGMSIVYLMQNCITCSGDTLPPMLITLIMIWVVQIPVAFLLSRFTGLGVYGMRWAIVIGLVMGAIAYITYFWMGRWKQKKV